MNDDEKRTLLRLARLDSESDHASPRTRVVFRVAPVRRDEDGVAEEAAFVALPTHHEVVMVPGPDELQ